MFCPKCGNILNPNSNFCNKCSYKIDNIPLNNEQINYNHKEHNIKMIFIGSMLGLVVVGIFLFLILILSPKSEKYYFDSNPLNSNAENLNNIPTPTKKGKYSTVIIYDNTYSGVDINNEEDAYDLIIKDSVSQKDNCPQEIQQVENDIINNYGITAVNLCEMDVDFAQELSNVFKKIYEEYPSVRGYITNLTLVNTSLKNNYIAAFMPAFNFATSSSLSTYPWVIKTQVLLNTTYFLNKSRLLSSVNEGANSHHFPENSTIYSPVAHELGHYLSFLAMMKHYQLKSILLVDSNNVNTFYDLYDDFDKGNYSLSILEEAYENYFIEDSNALSFDEWRGTISNYALAKDNSGHYIYDETIAESFHDVYLNGNNAADASKYIVSVLKKKLESR